MTYRIYARLSCLLKNVMSILRLALDGMSGLSDTCQLSLSKSDMSILRQALDGIWEFSDYVRLSCLLKSDMSILRQALDDLSDLCQAELLVEERYVYPSTGSGWHVGAFGYLSA